MHPVSIFLMFSHTQRSVNSCAYVVSAMTTSPDASPIAEMSTGDKESSGWDDKCGQAREAHMPNKIDSERCPAIYIQLVNPRAGYAPRVSILATFFYLDKH